MLAEILRPFSSAGELPPGLFPAEWLSVVRDRGEAEKSDFWFETLEQGDFGQTLVLITRPERFPKPFASTTFDPAGATRSIGIVRLDWLTIEQSLSNFAADFGLSPAVTRVVIGLFKACDVRAAAALCSVSYQTAWEHLEIARAAIGAENLPRLVTFMGLDAAMTDREGQETDALLRHAFSLTTRQVCIAGLIANGSPRSFRSRPTGAASLPPAQISRL